MVKSLAHGCDLVQGVSACKQSQLQGRRHAEIQHQPGKGCAAPVHHAIAELLRTVLKKLTKHSSAAMGLYLPIRREFLMDWRGTSAC